jgi:hypothetical protein
MKYFILALLFFSSTLAQAGYVVDQKNPDRRAHISQEVGKLKVEFECKNIENTFARCGNSYEIAEEDLKVLQADNPSISQKIVNESVDVAQIGPVAALGLLVLSAAIPGAGLAKLAFAAVSITLGAQGTALAVNAIKEPSLFKRVQTASKDAEANIEIQDLAQFEKELSSALSSFAVKKKEKEDLKRFIADDSQDSTI